MKGPLNFDLGTHSQKQAMFGKSGQKGDPGHVDAVHGLLLPPRRDCRAVVALLPEPGRGPGLGLRRCRLFCGDLLIILRRKTTVSVDDRNPS